MQSTIHSRLLGRELGSSRQHTSIRGIYGDNNWIDNLDIVNELGGHSGCVNALSWSKSGRLLASGSDDTHLLIHAYQPESTTNPFALTTSLSTGHSQNIFSVKFMPQSNDGTVVTAAGDNEVRVFDLEYSGRSTESSYASSAAAMRQTRGLGARGLENMYQGTRFLSDGNTNARVFRSHGDRVKRIVTESSPYLFLTCSEDGEVRQFDTRLPSSAYPEARRLRGGYRLYSGNNDDSNVPPPLISYKRYRLDLNTISCSPTQPHYIVLGGAHLHCFLHDRRMTGRDMLMESGSPGPGSSSPGSSMSQSADDLMGEATRCVRRFAPSGRKKPSRRENVHVTACKISDANPNEMIASWSGDHIYSFDLVNSPDARDGNHEGGSASTRNENSRLKESRDRKRKRKRKQENSSASVEGQRRASSRPRRSASQTRPDDVVLRLRYEDGRSEDMSIESAVGGRLVEQSRESVLNESQKRSMRIAKSVVRIRKLLFSLESFARGQEHDTKGLSVHLPSFTNALGSSAALVPEMDEIIRTWPYPVGPSSGEVAFHATLRQHRDSARRFVQACGTLAKTLGGRLRTAGSGPNSALEYFDGIKSSEMEGPLRDPAESFRYTFLKAILLWLDGGLPALLDGFKKKASRGTPSRLSAALFPIPEDADQNGIDHYLIPLLIQLASSSSTAQPITNVDASRFETDENRYLFADEFAAVVAFSNAIKIPLQDMSRALTYSGNNSGTATSLERIRAQDKRTALKYWGFKVGRGLLLNAGEGVNFALVDRAFGGLGVPRNVDEGRVQENIDPNTEEQVVATARVLGADSPRDDNSTDAEDGGIEGNGVEGNSSIEANEESENEMEDEDSDEREDDESDDEDDEEAEEDDEGLASHFIFKSTSERNRLHSQVQREIPIIPHTRKYTGHCNVKTVKDVNFFGLQDEYVVSGCDSGHLFIWERKTSRLLNILKGDGEVVNVIQGNSDSCDFFRRLKL